MVNVLDSKVKKDLLTWFVKLQLSEYLVLFAEDQEVCFVFLPVRVVYVLILNLCHFRQFCLPGVHISC